MRVLFDQATPVPIREFLVDHAVSTAAQQHWDRLKNGELLTAAEQAGFDVLLTTDKNMRYQQNLAGRPRSHGGTKFVAAFGWLSYLAAGTSGPKGRDSDP